MRPRLARTTLSRALSSALARRAPSKWAIVELYISTPIREQSDDPEELIGYLSNHAELATRRVRAIRSLLAAGWTMARPAIRLDDPRTFLENLQREFERNAIGERVTEPLHADGYLDFTIRFRKRYRDSDTAQDDVHELSLHDGRDNWSFGWDEQPDGDVAWWDEINGD